MVLLLPCQGILHPDGDHLQAIPIPSGQIKFRRREWYHGGGRTPALRGQRPSFDPPVKRTG